MRLPAQLFWKGLPGDIGILGSILGSPDLGKYHTMVPAHTFSVSDLGSCPTQASLSWFLGMLRRLAIAVPRKASPIPAMNTERL